MYKLSVVIQKFRTGGRGPLLRVRLAYDKVVIFGAEIQCAAGLSYLISGQWQHLVDGSDNLGDLSAILVPFLRSMFEECGLPSACIPCLHADEI